MNRKSVLSIIILCIFVLNIFSVISYVKALPYKSTTYNVSYTVRASSDDCYDLVGYQFRSNTTLGYLKRIFAIKKPVNKDEPASGL